MNDDASAVAEVIISSRKAFIPYAPMAHSAVETHHWVRNILMPSCRVSVACMAEAVVGILATSEAKGISWIDQLYVLPGFVGQGMGLRRFPGPSGSIHSRPMQAHAASTSGTASAR
ncbi:hypothetical protein LRH25_11980 [Ideonella azotifigens]|uniref:hypothetical protein n=1 Tax=Ideonella azotifigens TaxID=513160 RepID=UPI0011431EEA|nr:hypothetical protein [Ideonella azotifigens]MCD2341062.1 hypothetical protein [Ideonella azotifigens]